MFDLHIPVHVGGTPIFPNDLIHGDINGVTTIPTEIVPELLDVADEFIAAEQIILDTLRQPGVTVEQLEAARRDSRAQIDALAQRVSRKQG